MQLVAYGAQDIYLTGSPTITYFKVVYRRHTNFAMESIAQTFSGSVGFSNKVTALISRNGDLVSGMTLDVTLPATANNSRWIRNVGHVLVKQVDIEIGGQLIDRHYADWLEIWSQLTVTASKRVGYLKLVGQSPLAGGGELSGLQAAATQAATRLSIPLQFWFCRNVGLALPLIALQYHEVKVNITFADRASVLIAGTAAGELTAELWVDYIYLDTDERRRFAQVSHEYLIEQLQFTGNESYAAGATSKSVNLNFNHPVKELVFVCASTADGTAGNYVNAAIGAGLDNFANSSSAGTNPISTAILQLNGHDRFAVREGNYFNLEQPLKHHTCVPLSPGINVYSFALKPEDHQPSGTCNFSRIDNAKLNVTFGAGLLVGNLKVFATNYNVLRIMSGMGGLAYSN